MKYQFFTVSSSAWQAMKEDILKAKKTIFLESFILREDEITHDFFIALKTKAKQGVCIKIVIDRVAHFWYGSIDHKEFESIGIEVVYFRRWLYGLHRKILIIDDYVGYLGGVNIRGEYAKWLDLHLRIKGSLVKKFCNSFLRVYALAGGKDQKVLLKTPGKIRRAFYKSKIWFLEHWPFLGNSALQVYYQKKCAQAKNTITIVTPYFVPHKWLICCLQQASNRGVKIEVIVPGHTDVFWANIAHRRVMNQLKNFIDVYFIPEMNHAKILLIDDHEGLVGSNNVDAQSFDFNLEASVFFRRKDMVGDLKKIVEHWKHIAIPARNDHHYNRWYHKIIGKFISFFYPIL